MKFAVEIAQVLGWPEIEADTSTVIKQPSILTFKDGTSWVYKNTQMQWYPDTDANDDYDVLLTVQKWPEEKQELVQHELHNIWTMRRINTNSPEPLLSTPYQIGDYARATLAAVNRGGTMLNVDNFISCNVITYRRRTSTVRALQINEPFILEGRHTGKSGDYLVFADNGTKSISKREQFEFIYTELQCIQ
jgi:hypothetical protein